MRARSKQLHMTTRRTSALLVVGQRDQPANLFGHSFFWPGDHSLSDTQAGLVIGRLSSLPTTTRRARRQVCLSSGQGAPLSVSVFTHHCGRARKTVGCSAGDARGWCGVPLKIRGSSGGRGCQPGSVRTPATAFAPAGDD